MEEETKQAAPAFKRWLAAQSFDEACLYVVQCLLHGEQDNEAWVLLEEYNGPKWSTPPEHLREFIQQTLFKMKRDLTKGDNNECKVYN